MIRAASTVGGGMGVGSVMAGVLTLLMPCEARADSRSCDGPPACCPATIAPDPPRRAEVSVGVVLLGIYNVNERAGTWDADFYLNETWLALPGFVPQTEVVNEVIRQQQQFDTAELRDGRCMRSRRIHSTLRAAYNLRTFPFDHQRLEVQLSDSQFPLAELAYSDRARVAVIDEPAQEDLSSWKVEGGLAYTHAPRVFKGDEGAPQYDYATFSVIVRRHLSYHLTKFFLPLFVIVAVAFSVFWIDPDDLNSKVGVGVTCLLAAIAFQLAEAGSLPEVAYLTLADRVYALCYFALALAMVMSIISNSVSRRGDKERATRLDRRARIGFPLVLVVALSFGVLRAISQAN